MALYKMIALCLLTCFRHICDGFSPSAGGEQSYWLRGHHAMASMGRTGRSLSRPFHIVCHQAWLPSHGVQSSTEFLETSILCMYWVVASSFEASTAPQYTWRLEYLRLQLRLKGGGRGIESDAQHSCGHPAVLLS